LLRSWSNTLVSVRQVTQRNAGRRTAGIDRVVALDGPARIAVAREAHRTMKSWEPVPVRRVYIPNGHHPPGHPARTRRAGKPRAGRRAEREAIHGPDARLLQPRPQGPAAQEHSTAATRNVLSGLLEPDAGNWQVRF
jgi:N-terminal domain of reverse transcriptase